MTVTQGGAAHGEEFPVVRPGPDVLDDDPAVTAVMSTDVVAVDAAARLPTALHVMAATGVRHLPVVDRGRCVGVLVEADLVRHLAQGPGPSGTGATAALAQLCRPAPELPLSARVSEAARSMSADVSDAVLVSDRGRVVGIVTATDLVRLLARRDAGRAR
jgi:CBS domain-containing protein